MWRRLLLRAGWDVRRRLCLRTETQLNQRTGVGGDLGLPAIVGLQLLHGRDGGRVPAAGGFAGQIAMLDERCLNLSGALGRHGCRVMKGVVGAVPGEMMEARMSIATGPVRYGMAPSETGGRNREQQQSRQGDTRLFPHDFLVSRLWISTTLSRPVRQAAMFQDSEYQGFTQAVALLELIPGLSPGREPPHPR